MDQINHDPNVQNALLEKAEELLKAKDYETALGVLGDLIQYDAVREKYEFQLMAGIAYCLVFKFKDYPRADQMLQMITPENRKNIPEYYQGLITQTEQEIAANKTTGAADTPNGSPQDTQEPAQAQTPPEEPKKEVSAEEQAFLDKLTTNEKDLDTRFAYAKWLFEKAERNDEAIEECMQIMTQDKKWNDRAAYNLLIEIFNKMGAKNEKVIAARKRLSKILF